VSDFVTGPFQNALAYDEVAVEAVMPAPTPGATAAGGFLKLERRVGDFATAGAAVSVDLADGRVVRAGIALVGVGPRTLDAAGAAAALVGGVLDERAIETAAELAAGAAQPASDHRGSAAYKAHVVHTFVTRILTRIAGTTERSAA
jgi:carbon-monoxide dehydrogenase medium subunit